MRPYSAACREVLVVRAQQLPSVVVRSVATTPASAEQWAAHARALAAHTLYPNWRWQVPAAAAAAVRAAAPGLNTRLETYAEGQTRVAAAGDGEAALWAQLEVGQLPPLAWLFALVLKWQHLRARPPGLQGVRLTTQLPAVNRARADASDPAADRLFCLAADVPGLTFGLLAPPQAWALQEPLQVLCCGQICADWQRPSPSPSMAADAGEAWPVDVAVVTCVNDPQQYAHWVLGSLMRNACQLNLQVIPILNLDNRYNAAEALNLGVAAAAADVVVLCHQDVIFYRRWLSILMQRVSSLPAAGWGVLGTAGVTDRGEQVGRVLNMWGDVDWMAKEPRAVAAVQTVDEHCMVLRRSTGLRCDPQTMDGFHFYGADLCLSSLAQGLQNFGIFNPLVHHGSGGSIKSGKGAYDRALQRLAAKWQGQFNPIVTATAMVYDGQTKSCLSFAQ